ncbi:MAG: hypothetical protein HQ567_31380 [Candidatus Nealsonbacteria bacterium]|nr:hypothetical protein [Candidatus Nealsonbacteria bacterium]
MKWIIVLAMWTAAVAGGLAVLWRLARRRNIALRDRFSPKFVRIVAVILVVLGVGVESESADRSPGGSANQRSQSSAPGRDETIPDVLKQRVPLQFLLGERTGWCETLIGLENLSRKPDGQVEKSLEDAVQRLPEPLREIAAAEVKAVKTGRPKPTVTAEKIGAVLAQLEKIEVLFDGRSTGYLWRKTAQLPEKRDDEKVVELFTALHRHARIFNAVNYARAVTPFPRPRSTSIGPRRNWLEEHYAMDERMRLAVSVFPRTDAGTWQREATAVFAIDKDSAPATLIRAGERRPLLPAATVRLNRLDLIETPAGKPVVLEHDWLGALELPPGRIVTVWDLPGLLSADATDKIARATAAALRGDEQAIERIEHVLPLCHPAIRAALSESPEVAGAPRLCTILATFDDSLSGNPWPAGNRKEKELNPPFMPLTGLRR